MRKKQAPTPNLEPTDEPALENPTTTVSAAQPVAIPGHNCPTCGQYVPVPIVNARPLYREAIPKSFSARRGGGR